jgi:amino acid transporter
VITGATAVMYAFAPISLGALMKVDPTREHPYKLPIPKVLLPVGFAFANLIIYWGGFGVTWKLAVGLLIGQVIFVIAVLRRARNVDANARWKSALWIWPWLIGLVVLGLLGNYGAKGAGELHVLPEDFDALIVAAFGIVVYYLVVRTAQPRAEVERTVEADLLEGAPELRTAPGIA